MKRLFRLLIVALAISAFWFKDRWLPQPPGQLNHLGYIEGETVLIGAPRAGRIASVAVVKGNMVETGALLFELDSAEAKAEVAQAEASVATFQATYANLLTGKRDPERAVIREQIAQIEASLDLARKELVRATMLANTGTAAQSRLDAAAAQVQIDEARLRELKLSAEVAALPARSDEIAAAISRIAEAAAALAAARQKLSDLAPTAPRSSRVDDVFFDPGEWVAAGQPVVSLLSSDAITLRFYLPEAEIAAAPPGKSVTFHCDGCGDGMNASITRLANTPEYTPPVIYSPGARAKLVFLAEAKPDHADDRLRPGLPIEVEPLK